MKINNSYDNKKKKIVDNDSHGTPYKRAFSGLLIDKTYWIVALRMSVLVSGLYRITKKKSLYQSWIILL